MPRPGVRVLITGVSGYLGSALARLVSSARPAWESHGTYLSHPAPEIASLQAHRIDVCDRSTVRDLFGAVRPDIVFHTAARTTGELESLRAINSAATAEIAKLSDRTGARLIFTSTDLVFDGERGNYNERDAPHPIMAYGLSKAEGEQAVLAGGARALVVRTSLIYGFAPVDPRTLAIVEGRMPRLYTDEFRSPIWIESLCAALLELAESPHTGVLHVAGPQRLSRFEFGERLVNHLGKDHAPLIASLSAEGGVPRPRDCTLDSGLARSFLQTPLPGVDQVLQSIDLNAF